MTAPTPPAAPMSEERLLQIEKLYLGDARPFSFGWRDVICDLHAEVRRLRSAAPAPGVVVPNPVEWWFENHSSTVTLRYRDTISYLEAVGSLENARLAGPGEG